MRSRPPLDASKDGNVAILRLSVPCAHVPAEEEAERKEGLGRKLEIERERRDAEWEIKAGSSWKQG